MFKIIIKGEATTNAHHIEDLNHVECQEEFSQYLKESQHAALLNKGVHRGYMSFGVENGHLYTYTTYQSQHELTKEELELLGKFTQGQWSDGIGENFEQEPCRIIDGDEVYIQPHHEGQEITITQTKIK